eukprot:3821821-Rhodomonas_salina.4
MFSLIDGGFSVLGAALGAILEHRHAIGPPMALDADEAVDPSDLLLHTGVRSASEDGFGAKMLCGQRMHGALLASSPLTRTCLIHAGLLVRTMKSDGRCLAICS